MFGQNDLVKMTFVCVKWSMSAKSFIQNVIQYWPKWLRSDSFPSELVFATPFLFDWFILILDSTSLSLTLPFLAIKKFKTQNSNTAEKTKK